MSFSSLSVMCFILNIGQPYEHMSDHQVKKKTCLELHKFDIKPICLELISTLISFSDRIYSQS